MSNVAAPITVTVPPFNVPATTESRDPLDFHYGLHNGPVWWGPVNGKEWELVRPPPPSAFASSSLLKNSDQNAICATIESRAAVS